MRNPRLTKKSKDSINKFLYKLCKTYHNSIPLGEIDDILKENGCYLVQEDGTPWSGFLCGRNSRTTFTLHNLYNQEIDNVVALSWYKFDTGRYEINAYIS